MYIITSLKNQTSEDVAINSDIMHNLIGELVVPTWNAVAFYMQSNYPWFAAIFSRVFRKKIRQAHRKYLSGNTNGEQFFRFKTYRLFLYQLAEMHVAE